jgi:NADH-quinone oxidoreductase subunit N
VALLQKNFQRMMAYSTIAHIGYVLVGITAALSVGRELGLQGVSLHLASYTFAKVGVFVFLAYLLRKGVGHRVEDLRGLSKRCPVLSVAIVVILLNLIGVPPLLGFWSKFYLFTSVISFAPLLALAAIINSGISVGYYVLPIKYMFLPGRGKVEERLREPDAAVVVFASGLTIAAGLLLPAFAQLLVPT